MNSKKPIKIFLDILRITFSLLTVAFFLTSYAIDTDSDGSNDTNDAFPLNASGWIDTDSDGIGNNADADDDNDGVLDVDDEFPLDFLASQDSDFDGYPDYAELEIISNGQVVADWDFGINGVVGHYIAEPANIDQGDYSYRISSAYINHCSTEQSSNFDAFIQTSIDEMTRQEISLVPLGSQTYSENLCQYQNISTKLDISTNNSSHLEVEFKGIPVPDNENIIQTGRDGTDGIPASVNLISISRSNPINLSESVNLYLEVKVKTEPPVSIPVYWNPHTLMVSVGSELLIPLGNQWFYQFSPTDIRCYSSDLRINDQPFDPSMCDYKTYRIPLYNFSQDISSESINHFSFGSKLYGSGVIAKDHLKSIKHIMISSDPWSFQIHCNWFYSCDDYNLVHQIESVKIISGDQFDNDSTEYMDSDFDGIGSNTDLDNDNDGITNQDDAFEFNEYYANDYDQDGIPDKIDMDLDNDGAPIRHSFKFGNGNPEMGWVLEISENSLFIQAAEMGECEIYDLVCIKGQLPPVTPDNPLIIPTVGGGEIIWGGGNEFSSNDFDDDNDGYSLENDRFPRNTYEWADIDNDCVPDNIDNDLSSIADTDCDGLNNDIDTDDDNDSIPDNLVVNVVEDGIINSGWTENPQAVLVNQNSECTIDSFISVNPPNICNINNQTVDLSFHYDKILNIHSQDPSSYYLPAGFLEFKIQATNISVADTLEVTLETAMQEISVPLKVNISDFYTILDAENWVSVKFPLYDFFEQNTVRTWQDGTDNLSMIPYLSRIKKLGAKLKFHNSQFAISIKSIKFVVSDKDPQGIEWERQTGISSIDFDNDGMVAWEDPRPIFPDSDIDGDRLADELDNDIDGDYIENDDELLIGTNPNNPDTDGDGTIDGNDLEPNNPSIGGDYIEGVWRIANRVGSMGVGPYEGDISYWSIDDFELGRRDCVFDDTYTFIKDDNAQSGGGIFSQEMNSWTWLESWASPDGLESCGDPTQLENYPFDGLETGHTYKWDPEGGKLTVIGEGAHIGIPRIINDGEANVDGYPANVVYKVATASKCFISMNILSGNDLWWHFELERIATADGTPVTPESDFCTDSFVDGGNNVDSDAGDDFGTGNSGEVRPLLSWDIDGNGAADALTDGLLLLRHTFELTGTPLTNAAISSDSPLSSAEVESAVEGIYEIADIDKNETVDALTDSLLLLRYLFGLTGNSLINGAVANNALRADAADIEAYIQSKMP